MAINVALMIGSVRQGRNTPRLARLLEHLLAEDGRASVDVIDLRELGLPVLEERARNLEDPPTALVDLCARLAAADALVVVTPEYNKGYPAALKNAIDSLGQELRRKPVAIAAHSVGAFGGQVVLQQLRPVFSNLGAVPIPAILTLPHIAQAIDDDGTPADEQTRDRAVRFLEELLWYGEALRRQRELSQT